MSAQPWDEHYKPTPEEWAQMLKDKAEYEADMARLPKTPAWFAEGNK